MYISIFILLHNSLTLCKSYMYVFIPTCSLSISLYTYIYIYDIKCLYICICVVTPLATFITTLAQFASSQAVGAALGPNFCNPSCTIR